MSKNFSNIETGYGELQCFSEFLKVFLDAIASCELSDMMMDLSDQCAYNLIKTF